MLQIEKDSKGFDKKGVELIYNKFNDTLKTNGLEETKVEVGDVFNPWVFRTISHSESNKL